MMAADADLRERLAQLQTENAALRERLAASEQELDVAREQQTATSDVLRVISNASTDLHRVLDAVADAVMRLCDASDANIWLSEGAELVLAARRGEHEGVIPVGARIAPDSAMISAAAIRARRAIHICDAAAEADAYPQTRDTMRSRGLGAAFAVPLLRDGRPLGTLTLGRGEARAFTDQQLTLAQTFADQAVIAIENARLFDEVQARSAELEERNREQADALAREQATADVLRIISAAPQDITSVLSTILETAHSLVGVTHGGIWRFDGEVLRLVVGAGMPAPFWAQLQRTSRRPGEGYPMQVAALERRTIHVPDVRADPRYAAHFAGNEDPRSYLAVPLVRSGDLLGMIVLIRTDVQPFTEDEIALVEMFADQAVIAIENARLFEELQTSNATLREALEQQTATAEVLRVISRAPADLHRVLYALAENTRRLFGADSVTITGIEGELVEQVVRSPTAVPHPYSGQPMRAGTLAGRALSEGRAIGAWGEQADLIRLYPGMGFHPETRFPLARMVAPLLRQGEAIGAITVSRSGPAPFTDKHLALLDSFADQAVIAMENARLFTELQERNREQAEALEREQATAEVLRVISQSPENLDASLQAVADTAARLCHADISRVWLRDGDYLVAGPRASPIGRDDHRQPGDRTGPLAERAGQAGPDAVRTGRTVHVTDPLRYAKEHGASARVLEQLADVMSRIGQRTALQVPLLRGDAVVGLLSLVRLGEGRPFSERDIALAESFADQAVIAIENARLFDEIQAKSRELEAVNAELEAATQHKSAFISSMSHELRTPLNAIIGYSEMLQEEAEDLGAETFVADLAKVNAAAKHLLSLINNVLDLSKIEAGRMDLYLEDFAVADLLAEVAAVVQPLVEQKGNTLVVEADGDLGVMHADLTKVRQALFNLLSNAAKFTERGTITLTVDVAPGSADLSPGPSPTRRGAGGEVQGEQKGQVYGHRHRHRHDRGAAGEALPGVHAGGGGHGAALRRDGTGAGLEPGVLPDDGRRHYRRKCAGRRFDVHHPPAGRAGVTTCLSGRPACRSQTAPSAYPRVTDPRGTLVCSSHRR